MGRPAARSPLAVLAGLKRAVRHDHANDAAVSQVEIDAAGEEQPCDILVRGIPAARPDAVNALTLAFQFRPEGGNGAVVVEPWRIADNHIHFVTGEGDGTYEVSGVVCPDMVTALGVKSAHGVNGLFESASLGGIGYAVVVEG